MLSQFSLIVFPLVVEPPTMPLSRIGPFALEESLDGLAESNVLNCLVANSSKMISDKTRTSTKWNTNEVPYPVPAKLVIHCLILSIQEISSPSAYSRSVLFDDMPATHLRDSEMLLTSAR